MRFDIFSLFPEVFAPYIEVSILKRAIQSGLMDVYLHDIRAWTLDRHHVCDDTPYGGGGGMVMKPEPIFDSVEDVLGSPPACPLILMTPQGRPFNQAIARELAQYPRLALLCGRYEGVDERVRQHLVTDEISVGDYVLTGGELPAMIIMDSVIRNIPGVLGDPNGASNDSHASGLLEYPHYTKPAEFRSWGVPDVLRTGNHPLISEWRHQQALRRTFERRPDMLEHYPLSKKDKKLIKQWEEERQQNEGSDEG
ncbi:MAG: tRNA (guanosine(37)-N1)-methyltransferase TrmD [Anaerolineaceae bacterium]|nr:tRNA (guanosine(37)-N1)-methyltransferase TrmD [Anaerolineaceae bacterium]